LAWNINERTNALQSFVGRMMNHQAELMTWRGELPAHLAPKDTATTERLRAWGRIPWVQRQCCDIELSESFVAMARTLVSCSDRVQPCDACHAPPILRRCKLLNAILLICHGQKHLYWCCPRDNSACPQGTGT
jgi:hypothetical protein